MVREGDAQFSSVCLPTSLASKFQKTRVAESYLKQLTPIPGILFDRIQVMFVPCPLSLSKIRHGVPRIVCGNVRQRRDKDETAALTLVKTECQAIDTWISVANNFPSPTCI